MEGTWWWFKNPTAFCWKYFTSFYQMLFFTQTVLFHSVLPQILVDCPKNCSFCFQENTLWNPRTIRLCPHTPQRSWLHQHPHLQNRKPDSFTDLRQSWENPFSQTRVFPLCGLFRGWRWKHSLYQFSCEGI